MRHMKVKIGDKGRRFNLLLIIGLIAVSVANTWLVFTRSQILPSDCSGDKDVLLKALRDAQASYQTHHHDGETYNSAENSMQINTGCQQNPVLCRSIPLLVNHSKVRILGKSRPDKVFLTIGIPTVYRNHVNATYLSTTLQSLIINIEEKDYKDILLVVFLADFNPKLRHHIRTELYSTFKNHIENTGLIHVIEAPRVFYPSLSNLKQKFDDSYERVYWRSKQSVDYAFLLSYCRNLSKFYLQLEDDVVASMSYFKQIKDYVDARPLDWISISFSVLGFIGKLFRAEDLDPMAKFILFFFDELPVDITYQYYLAMKGKATLKFTPSLFQHIGDISSLKNKAQLLKDPAFVETFEAKELSDNPPAKFFTSLKIFQAYTPALAYSRTQNFFWGRAPYSGDTLNVVFDKGHKLERVIVHTGMKSKPYDVIREGMLQACPAMSAARSLTNIKKICEEHCFVTLGNFQDGKIDIDVVKAYGNVAIKCLRIVILKDQDAWVLVRDIAVWVKKS